MTLHGDIVGASRAERFAAVERRIGRVTHLMDEVISIKGTPIKVGLDPVIGMIPVAGDAVTAAVGAWVILEAWRFGVPRVVVGRMVLNLLVDLAIGAIPILGDLYDVFFRSNSRNLDLFRRHALDPGSSTRGQQAFFVGLVLLMVGIVWLAATAVTALLNGLSSVRI